MLQANKARIEMPMKRFFSKHSSASALLNVHERINFCSIRAIVAVSF